MSILAEAEAFLVNLRAHFAPEIKTVENEAHEIVNDAVSYIKVNGLQDLEQIALTLVAAMVPGTSWGAVLTAVRTQAVTDGVKLLQGAEAIVAAKAQADLIAAGKLVAPTAA
jgi:hypothetical protein